MADPYTVSVDDLQNEERQRKADVYDRMFGGYGGDDTQLKLAEDTLINQRNQPEAPYQRPRRSTTRNIFGSILQATRGGHQVGNRLLYEPEAQAMQDYEMGIKSRQRLEGREAGNVNTLTGQVNREQTEGFRLQRQQNLLGKDLDAHKLNEAGVETQGARAELYRAEAEKARSDKYKAGSPGAMIFSEDTGTVKDKGNPDIFGKSRGSTMFAPLNPGQGTYNRVTGARGIVPDPAAARATRYPPGSGRPGSSVALDRASAKAETDKSKAYIAHKKIYDSKLNALKQKYGPDSLIDTTNKVLSDGSQNPNFGADQRELQELNTWDAQQKNAIERSYSNQRKAAGLGEQQPYQFGRTEMNMGVTGEADEAAMRPATGEDPAKALRQELGPGEILFQDPESGKYFAGKAERREEYLNEGYEEVPEEEE